MAFADIDHTQTVTFTFAFVTDSQDHERSPLRVKRGRAIVPLPAKGFPGQTQHQYVVGTFQAQTSYVS